MYQAVCSLLDYIVFESIGVCVCLCVLGGGGDLGKTFAYLVHQWQEVLGPFLPSVSVSTPLLLKYRT